MKKKYNPLPKKHERTVSFSSPKNSRRGCLCKNRNEYSVKCCDGLLVEQGIGVINSLKLPPVITAVKIEWLVVAGGGAAGTDNAGGGGGGGLLSGSYIVTDSISIQTILGAGGTAFGPGTERDGKHSSISSSAFVYEAIGGGGGGINQNPGRNGGSGGGGGYFLRNQAGGTGSLGQGNNGGSSFFTEAQSQRFNWGGGGGGAGTESIRAQQGGGGTGSMWLDGNYYAGGGGGGRNNAFCTSIRCETARIARGGLGGGGNGGIKFEDNQPATPGQPNTGGGGGGDGTGYSGGSGVIIFRYGSNYLTSGSIIGGDYIYTSDGYTYHKFLNVTTSSFNITFPQ